MTEPRGASPAVASPPTPEPRIPLWARALLAGFRQMRAAEVAAHIILSEIMLLRLPRSARDAVTALLYARHQAQLPGGSLAAHRGLLDWERDVLQMDAFPKSGRILVGGAGAGRELFGLRDAGYETFGFEPCEPLWRTGIGEIGTAPGMTLALGSYDDFVAAVRGAPSPLRALVASGPFDAIVLGVGSLSHVTDADDRLNVLLASRRLAPNAPVLLSFLRRVPEPHAARRESLRRVLRRVLGKVGSAAPHEGESFTYSQGFTYAFTRAEVEALANAAGYAMAHFAFTPYAHALLVPADGVASRSER